MQLTQAHTHDLPTNPRHIRRIRIRLRTRRRHENTMRTLSIANPDDLCRHILRLREVDEGLTPQLHAQLALVVAAVYADNTHPHGFRQLHAHMSHTSARTGKSRPVSRLESRLLQRAVNRRARAHDRACREIIDAVGDALCIARGTEDVLLVATRKLETDLRAIVAVGLAAGPAKLAVEAGVVGGLDAGAVADFPVCDVGADGDDDAGALVAGGAHAEGGHRGDREVVEHVVDVAVADAGSVQLDEDVVGAWRCIRFVCLGIRRG